MSHFYTVVIVPDGTEPQSFHDEVERLLAPYDENIEVPEYERDCHCIGRVARKFGKAEAEKVKKIDTYRDEWNRKAKEAGKDMMESFLDQKGWEEFIADWTKIKEEKEKEHPDYGKPDPECDDCNGTGKYKTTYNPKSKWDWWVIGGRWDGTVPGNAIPVSELTDEIIPFAMVTPDGEWHQKGDMGWWGMTSNEMSEEDWVKEVNGILKVYSKCIAIGCDLHI